MDADELRSIQAPFKEKYQDDPEAAVITLSASGEISEGVTCSVQTARALAGDMLLEALVACAGVTLNAVATALEIELKGGRIKAEGELDMRGTLGVAKEAAVGFRNIRLAFELESDAEDDKLALLKKLTERYCVVYQTLQQSPPIETSMTTA